ncbi:uncharacterized protein LOC117786767 [Drosophila innubila]|uniref:uncharacterized protein LOC117786767 n=1 Tax=Drosophila innubila TaxID=198719 RepID=UPI00148C2F62|nr:uncharacterized protein LOC117786767 [Drosophila innubila]
MALTTFTRRAAPTVSVSQRWGNINSSSSGSSSGSNFACHKANQKELQQQKESQIIPAQRLFTLLLLLTTTLLQARRISSRRLVIHVPVKVKTHHHTHTVYKMLHGSGGGGGIKQTVYKVVGFDEGSAGKAHGSRSYGHGPSHSYGHSHGMDHGEITYEDKHGCESGKLMPSHRDMLFNHYARHDQEESEATDYAEERDEFIDVRDAWL